MGNSEQKGDEDILAIVKNISIKVETINDNQTKIITTQERIEKRLDILDSDRSILEDINGKSTELKEDWRMSRESIRGDIRDAKLETQTSSDRIIATVKTEIESIKNLIDTKRIIEAPQKPLWKRILRR